MTFAREGYNTILVVVVFAIIVSIGGLFLDHWASYIIYSAMLFLVGFMLFFFRDPDREIPDEDNLIIAPADGSIVLIKEVEETIYLKARAKQVSIFLSPLDVHVNRIPATGTIEYLKYNPGVYLMAWDHRASDLNERADFGIRHPSGIKIFFRQITGFLARRIVYHISEGDMLKAGQRFGMMKFGSRMDILVPIDIELQVKEGDRTVAGKTIIATIE